MSKFVTSILHSPMLPRSPRFMRKNKGDKSGDVTPCLTPGFMTPLPYESCQQTVQADGEVKSCEETGSTVYKRLTATAALLHQHAKQQKDKEEVDDIPKEEEKVQWPSDRYDYELGEIIGIGATATVHSAYCISRKEKCAIKRINLEKCNTSMDELLKEIQAMRACNHPNVVSYYTSFVFKDELWLVIKLLAGGSLLDIIKHQMRVEECKNGVFDEATIATVLREVLKGLEYFHHNGQIHRDIKAGNILLGEDGTVQIADFGVSAWLNSAGSGFDRQKSRHTFVGTPCWMAPEVMEQVTGYDYKADIWSLGITALELITGNAPYAKYPPMKVLMLTLQNDPPTLESVADEKDQYKGYGKTIRKMISDCLQKDPNKRPTASELLKHPFFKKAKDKKYLTQTLLLCTPNIDKRAQRFKGVKKSAPKEPRMGRRGSVHPDTGDWVWSDDDEEEDEEEVGSFSDEDAPIHIASPEEIAAMKEAIRIANLSASSSDNEDNENERGGRSRKSNHNSVHKKTEPAPPPVPTIMINDEQEIQLALRIRNLSKELNDIKFGYLKSRDTAEGTATDLVNAMLVREVDKDIVARSLQQIVDNAVPGMSVVFPLAPNPELFPVPDERSLIGFAQIKVRAA